MDRVLEVILAVVVIGVTLAFGGVQPITYSLMEIVLFLGLLLLVLQQARRGEIRLSFPLWPVVFALLVGLQLVPLPARLVHILCGGRTPGLPLATPPPSTRIWATLSIYPHQTELALLRFLAYLAAFALAVYVFDSRKGKSTLLRALIALACFEASYGIVQYLTGWQKIFTYTKIFDMYEATGTYINRNHFAGLIELVIPFVAASAFYSLQLRSRGVRHSAGGSLSSRWSRGTFRAVFYLFLLVIMGVAIVYSRSRSGILSAMISCLLVAVLGQVKARGPGLVPLLVFVLTAIVGYGLWIGLDPVLVRFEQVHTTNLLQMEGRTQIWTDTVQLVREQPLLGTGLGTYEVAFRQHQSNLVNYIVDHAHNDYLEFASDTGLIGFALLFLPVFYLFFRMIVSFFTDPHLYRRSVTLGCIGSTLALLIHSITDFNLQIPANALIFAIVLGIGYKVACIERREQNTHDAMPISLPSLRSRRAF